LIAEEVEAGVVEVVYMDFVFDDPETKLISPCATFMHAYLSRYYEYPPKKQASSNMIKHENENLNPQ